MAAVRGGDLFEYGPALIEKSEFIPGTMFQGVSSDPMTNKFARLLLAAAALIAISAFGRCARGCNPFGARDRFRHQSGNHQH
jgi:hypothetical protein